MSEAPDIEALYRSFNSTIRGLVNRLRTSVESKDVELVNRLARRIDIVLHTDDTYLIRKTGSKLFTYRKEIAERNERFFLDELDYQSDDVDADSDIAISRANAFDDEEEKYLVDLVKKAYRESASEERNNIYQNVRSLLQYYCKYQILLRRK